MDQRVQHVPERVDRRPAGHGGRRPFGPVPGDVEWAGRLRQPIPAGDCTLELGASPGSTTVSRIGSVLAERELDPPRVVALAATDLSMDDAEGMQAVVHADARFESSPSSLKLVLLGLYAAAAVA